MSNDVFNTVKTDLRKSNKPLHTATIFQKILILVVRKRSKDVGLEKFFKQVTTFIRYRDIREKRLQRKVLKECSSSFTSKSPARKTSSQLL